MNDSATSLDRMHDIVLPEPVAWWPPAPGWYVVLAALLVIALYVAMRAGERWRRNAYRRAALQDLETATSVFAISELLRRTALVVSPRPVVAAQVGASWPLWLQQTAPVPITELVQKQLALGSYEQPDPTVDVNELKQYAAQWIKRHPHRKRSVAPSTRWAQ